MFRNERQFVRWLQSRTSQRGRRLRAGIGDDAALVSADPRRDVILTTDLTVERVHFASRLHPPEAIGHRALARALSDVAAMGGEPKFALVSLALSSSCGSHWIKSFYRGLLRLAGRFGVLVIGGDTAIHSGPAVVDVIVTGEVLRGQAIRRSGAAAGDLIFVGGRLGCSALGLKLLRANRTPAFRKSAEGPIRVHLFPEPQCRLGALLSRKQIATSAIDLSDGLSVDLARLCEASGVGARLQAHLLPLPADPGYRGAAPLDVENLALNGGEDYKLLFTVSPERARSLPAKLADAEIFRIGEVTQDRRLWLVRKSGRQERLLPAGYDHFRQSRQAT